MKEKPRTSINESTELIQALNASLRLHTDYCILVEALKRIANQDYRGNAPTEVSIAREALSKINNT